MSISRREVKTSIADRIITRVEMLFPYSANIVNEREVRDVQDRRCKEAIRLFLKEFLENNPYSVSEWQNALREVHAYLPGTRWIL